MLGYYYCLYFLEFSYYIPPNCTFGIELKALRDKFRLEKTFLRSLMLSSGTGNKLTDSGLSAQKMGLKKLCKFLFRKKRSSVLWGKSIFLKQLQNPKEYLYFG